MQCKCYEGAGRSWTRDGRAGKCADPDWKKKKEKEGYDHKEK